MIALANTKRSEYGRHSVVRAFTVNLTYFVLIRARALTAACGFARRRGKGSPILSRIRLRIEDDAGARPARRIRSERQYKSRKRDNPHRLLHTTMDQIRKTIPDGLPTAV